MYLFESLDLIQQMHLALSQLTHKELNQATLIRTIEPSLNQCLFSLITLEFRIYPPGCSEGNPSMLIGHLRQSTAK